ncbi:hypothetical protein [Maribellus mangrovi]|uniref:hypothetical protein n=1 Tax=Maribellus mangrovi TaxID=3133146 RepID=UPI0030EEB780
MKKLNLLAVLVIVFFLATSVSNATGVRSALNEYEIAPVEDLHMGKQVKAIWTISYSKEEVPVTVVKRNTIEGTEYVVQSDYFVVSYYSNAAGFGVKETRRSWSEVPKKVNKAVLNQEEMQNQRIISPNKMEDEKALGLIASYLPDLINDGYTHILN